MQTMTCRPKTYSLIDTGALQHNYKLIRSSLPESCRMMCVVKADCYGHGIECVNALCKAGADFFAVSSLQEALQVRQYTDADVLILSYTPAQDAEYLLENNFIQTVYSTEYASQLLNTVPDGKKLRVHIKIDTGMNRIGFPYGDIQSIKNVLSNNAFSVEGIFTHFAASDEYNKSSANEQLSRFISIKEQFGDKYLYHCANTGAIISMPDSLFDFARCGISLYGVSPSDEVRQSGLLPVMKLCSTVVHVHTVRKGESISYGGTYTAQEECTIATVACGYGDGVPRAFSSGTVTINGHECTVVGRVCMDHLMVDITDMNEKPKTGDVAVIFGDVEKYARHIGTIPYEALCMVGKRVQRIII
ncbi:MAG: alanine racemase [Clostridia bacterium]|nr:alanine racemase [Clostridia bacterium]